MIAVVADELTEIVVVNHYRVLVYPRHGAFTVAVDRRRVGRAPQGGELRWSVTPGAHTVRIQLWHFYKSPRMTVEAVPGVPSVLTADKPAGPTWKGMLRLTLRPFTSLSLELEPARFVMGHSRPSPELDEMAVRRRQRAFQIYAVSMALAFLAIIAVLKLSG